MRSASHRADGRAANCAAASPAALRTEPGDGRRGQVVAAALLLARMAAQAVVMLSVARLLGATGYGAFAGVVALAALFAPLSGLGADSLALRAVAEVPSVTRAALVQGMRAILVTGGPLLVAVFGVAVWWFDRQVSWALVLAVLVADILMLRIPELVAKIFQGRVLVTEMGIARLLPAGFRLFAIAGLWLSPWTVTPTTWAFAYALGSAAAALFAVLWLRRYFLVAESPAVPDLLAADGLHFAGGVLSARLHCEADKALVMALSGSAAAGIYAAAYRVVEFALVPVNAAQSVVYGSLFGSAHRNGAAAAARAGLRATAYAFALGLAATVALWFALAPAMHWVLGPSFAAVHDGVLPMALLPALMSLRLSGEQNVAAIGRLRERSFVQWLLATAALCANLLLIARYGWVGAAWVSVATEAALGLCYAWFAMDTIRVARRSGEASV